VSLYSVIAEECGGVAAIRVARAHERLNLLKVQIFVAISYKASALHPATMPREDAAKTGLQASRTPPRYDLIAPEGAGCRPNDAISPWAIRAWTVSVNLSGRPARGVGRVECRLFDPIEYAGAIGPENGDWKPPRHPSSGADRRPLSEGSKSAMPRPARSEIYAIILPSGAKPQAQA